MTFLVLTVNNDKFGYLEDIIPYDVDEDTFLVLEEIGYIIKIFTGLLLGEVHGRILSR